jgi:hypothetical protein
VVVIEKPEWAWIQCYMYMSIRLSSELGAFMAGPYIMTFYHHITALTGAHQKYSNLAMIYRDLWSVLSVANQLLIWLIG